MEMVKCGNYERLDFATEDGREAEARDEGMEKDSEMQMTTEVPEDWRGTGGPSRDF